MEEQRYFDRTTGEGGQVKEWVSLKSRENNGSARMIPALKIVLVALMATFLACTKPSNSIKGHIEGLSNDTVFVTLVSLSNWGNQEPVLDTVLAKNGRVDYVLPDNEAYGVIFSFRQFYVYNRPTGGLYKPNNSGLTLFVEPNDKISFKGEFNSGGLHNVILSGSKLNQDFTLIQNKIFEIRMNEIEEEMALEQAMVDANKEFEDVGLEKRRDRNNARMEFLRDYIRSNPDNPLSALLLIQQPIDSMGMHYRMLGENAHNSIFRGVLDQAMEHFDDYSNTKKVSEEVLVGNKVPDFTLKDIDGNPFTLSTIQDKYVIIDFWGSWCGPCISGIPRMKSLYEKYRNQLEIVGIACNEESVAVWQDAVKQHGLPWINVYDDDRSPVNVLYGVMGFPTKIVMDSEGTILIREQGEGDDFYKKVERVINTINTKE